MATAEIVCVRVKLSIKGMSIRDLSGEAANLSLSGVEKDPIYSLSLEICYVRCEIRHINNVRWSGRYEICRFFINLSLEWTCTLAVSMVQHERAIPRKVLDIGNSGLKTKSRRGSL